MSIENEQIFEFGPFVLDPLAHTLVKDGRDIPLPPKAFAVLLVLVRNAGHIVEREEIFREVWPDVFVEDQNVCLNIHLARKALGDDADNPTYIATVARRGYRFAAPVINRNRVAPERVPSVAELEVPATMTIPTSGDGNSSGADAFRRGTISLRLLRSAFGEDGWFLLTSCTL